MVVLRRQLIVFSITLLVIPIVAGFSLYIAQQEILFQGVQTNLHQVAELIQSDFTEHNQPLDVLMRAEIDFPVERGSAFEDSPIAVLLLDDQLNIIASSNNSSIRNVDLFYREAVHKAFDGTASTLYSTMQDGSRLMVHVAPLLFQSEPIAVAVVAQSLARIDRALEALILVFGLLSGTLALLVAVLYFYSTRHCYGVEPERAAFR